MAALLVFVATIALDQLTKVWAMGALRGAPVHRYLGDVFRLEYALNAGSFLSLGDRLPAVARVAIFVVGVGLLLLWLLIFGLGKPGLSGAVRVALLAIAAGGLSNWVDRVIRGGTVVDFMNLGIGSLRTGIFNVADLAIVFGGVWLAFYGLGKDEEDGKSTRTPSSPSDAGA